MSSHYWRRFILLLLLSTNIPHAPVSATTKKIRLTDIQVLTATKGLKTKARRTAAIDQLTCVKGNACKDSPIESMQCYNKGFDGVDVQWECKTGDLDEGYRLGSVTVACEG
jgi:hypothetical protein